MLPVFYNQSYNEKTRNKFQHFSNFKDLSFRLILTITIQRANSGTIAATYKMRRPCFFHTVVEYTC